MPSRSTFRILCAFVSATLVTTGFAVLVPTGASAAAPVSQEKLSRPDSVSAMVTARASGRRVEDLSRRSETAQVFANPDGTWTAEEASEPVKAAFKSALKPGGMVAKLATWLKKHVSGIVGSAILKVADGLAAAVMD